MLLLGKKQVQQLLCVLAKSLCIKYLQVFPQILHTHLHNMTITNIVTCLASLYEYAYNYTHTYYVVHLHMHYLVIQYTFKYISKIFISHSVYETEVRLTWRWVLSSINAFFCFAGINMESKGQRDGHLWGANDRPD